MASDHCEPEKTILVAAVSLKRKRNMQVQDEWDELQCELDVEPDLDEFDVHSNLYGFKPRCFANKIKTDASDHKHTGTTINYTTATEPNAKSSSVPHNDKNNETDNFKTAPVIRKSVLESVPENVAVQEPLPLQAGDRLLFHYGRVILEGQVYSTSKQFVLVKVSRTHIPHVHYPWGNNDPLEDQHRRDYQHEQDNGYIVVKDKHVLVRLPTEARCVVAVSRHIMDLETCVYQRHVASTVDHFQDHYLNVGDQIEMIVQGDISSSVLNLDDAQGKTDEHRCPYPTRLAEVTKERNDNNVRIEYHAKSVASVKPVCDWIDRTSLACWRRLRRAKFLQPSSLWKFRRATDGPINPHTGQVEPL